ncbi:MAG: hypothetical protein ACTSUE_26865 [Promethearchaeota archaeon]
MKKLPCCITCAKSDTLCYSCQERLNSGDLTDLDLDLAEYFLELEDENPDLGLSEVNFYKSIDLKTLVILIVGKGESEVFKKVLKKVRHELQLPRIQIIEKSVGSINLKNLLNDFVQPGKLLGINKIFLPTGEIEFKAKVQLKERDRLPISRSNLEALIEELTDSIVRIELVFSSN